MIVWRRDGLGNTDSVSFRPEEWGEKGEKLGSRVEFRLVVVRLPKAFVAA